MPPHSIFSLPTKGELLTFTVIVKSKLLSSLMVRSAFTVKARWADGRELVAPGGRGATHWSAAGLLPRSLRFVSVGPSATLAIIR